MLYVVLLLLMTSLDVGSGFPVGAPLEACDTMFPDHGVEAQTDFNPYFIAFFPTTYSDAETIFG